jgi:hypothetical protein
MITHPYFKAGMVFLVLGLIPFFCGGEPRILLYCWAPVAPFLLIAKLDS